MRNGRVRREGVIDRDKLAKVLALLTSPMDGEVVAAARVAVMILAAAGLRPGDLVKGIYTLNELLRDEPPSPRPRATPPDPSTPETRPKAEKKRSFANLYPSEARRVLADFAQGRGFRSRHRRTHVFPAARGTDG